ncbi:protein arginine N-methyltransferase 6-like [Amphiura filiformis]|uniref:protein arginine N-methyltransferase 6-like n=1 Tax=Amphiura filiformis TaxID=82378 RepID=UPI003B210CD0
MPRVRACVIRGCKSAETHFVFPKTLQGRLWKDAVWPHLKDSIKQKYPTKDEWDPHKYGRICIKHFKNGQKSPFPGLDGYMPTLFPEPDEPKPVDLTAKKENAQRIEMLSMITEAFHETKKGRPRGKNSRLNIGIDGSVERAAAESSAIDAPDEDQDATGDTGDTIAKEEEEEEPEAKRVCSQFDEDDSYFKSYGDIGIHEDMIRDTVRTNTYRMAILKSVNRIAGKVVLDVGAGTGILSCFCAQAGAKKVYAIEASQMAEQAKKVVEANGLSNKITVIHGKVEEVTVPERVDVIVSEWMGHFLLYESMLNSVILARNKWLKLGGIILPGVATLYLAPITNEDIYKERIEFWDETKKMYGVDMSCLKGHARKCTFGQVQLEEVIGSDLIGESCQIAKINIHLATLQDLNKVMGKFNFKCFGSLPLCGFVSWFTVTFNIPGKESVHISTAPDKHTTHWKQTVMYLDEPVAVEQDTEISGNIVLTPGQVQKRCLDVSLTFQVQNTAYIRKYYMGPEEPNS